MKSINQQAPVKCIKSIRINASSKKVWMVLTDINHWANWQTDISNPTLQGAVKPGTVFTWKTGGAAIRSVLHTVEPFQYFGWSGKTFGMLAVHNWTLKEDMGQCLVSVEESMEGLLAMLLKKTFNKSLERGMERWLEMLMVECERE